jgi:hypothetical protein
MVMKNAVDSGDTSLAQKSGQKILTFRSLLLGLILTAVTDFWIHWAELVLGQKGHTALANTSIPVGAFNVLFLLVIINILLTKFLKPYAFSQGELLVIYVMMTVSTVISSSGGIHFIVPTITAAFFYGRQGNGWDTQFFKYIPNWIAVKSQSALDGFYEGNSHVPWHIWAKPMIAWVGFLVIFSLATLCIVIILRRQWSDRERLAFPTVIVPTEMIRDGEGFLTNKLLWIGFAIPFCIDVINTIHMNIPSVPYFPTRTTDQPDLLNLFTSPPYNAIGSTPISFYPFVLGIAYLLSVEMTFSCWFFWLVTKIEFVVGAATGINSGGTAGGMSAFPYIGHQGAGAFIALTFVGLWISRGYLREVWMIAFSKRKANIQGLSDKEEPAPYRVAFIGLAVCMALLVGWCAYAGMRSGVAIVLILLSLTYMIAATRIRAETGNAWLWGPNVDAYKVMTTTFGSNAFTPTDLTILAYVRNAIANFDLRCITMPNQFDAYKMSDTLKVDKRQLTIAMVLALAFGIAVSFAIALMIWYAFGAGAKCEPWRTYMGRVPFDQLSDALKTPVKNDLPGTMAMGVGFLITTVLMFMRSQFIWWPFHPVGYAMANTNTMNAVWLPFFLAWLTKTLILHYGGMRLYRKSLPFFYGMIIGDFLAGGLTTLTGCLTGINVYPINW